MLRISRLFWLPFLCLFTTAAATPSPQDPASLMALAQQLELLISESGPKAPWQFTLANNGATPVGVAADLGLLTLEVKVPGRKGSATCTLPSPLRPDFVRQRTRRVLAPGQHLTWSFDPRLFCFASLKQSLLIPNAQVTPHFGWPYETKTIWRHGKRLQERLPPRAPFVAWVAEPEPEAEPSAPTAAPAPTAEVPAPAPPPSEAGDSIERSAPHPTEGLKQLSGGALVLGPEYAEWSSTPSVTGNQPLSLAMVAGSDAEDERSARITLSLTNVSAESEKVFLRRELISYRVKGPDGSFTCPRVPIGPSSGTAFSTLRPGAKRVLVTRLIEVCPMGSFERPGLYEIRAKLSARWSGQRFGFDAFTGRLKTQQRALVRIRTGNRPFPRRADLPGQDVGSGPGATVDGAAPGSITDEGSSIEDPSTEGGADEEPVRDDTPDESEDGLAPDDPGPSHTEPSPEPPPDPSAE